MKFHRGDAEDAEKEVSDETTTVSRGGAATRRRLVAVRKQILYLFSYQRRGRNHEIETEHEKISWKPVAL